MYDRCGYCNQFKGNAIRGSVGDCGVVRDRCKGQSDGFQNETELFGGEHNGSRCGANQEVGNEEAIVGIIEGVNTWNDLGDSSRYRNPNKRRNKAK